jgi:DNA repair exonuclease SbcCD ATPase subunit
MKPNSLKVFKNDTPFEMLSTRELNQDEITKILGIDYKMFKQIVSLAVTYNKPFLTLEAAEKREIVESIFNVKIFGAMSDALKKKISTEKVKYAVNKKTVEMLEENINLMRKNIIENKRANAEFETNRQADIKGIETDLISTKTLISRMEREIAENIITEAKLKAQQTELTEIITKKEEALKIISDDVNNETVNGILAELKEIADKITALEDQIGKMGREEIHFELDEKIIDLNKKNEVLQSQLTDIRAKIDTAQKNKPIYAADTEYSNLIKEEVDITDNQIPDIKKSISEITGDMPLSTFIKSIRDKNSDLTRQETSSKNAVETENNYIYYLKNNNVCSKCKGPITEEFRALEIKKSEAEVHANTLVLETVRSGLVACEKTLILLNGLVQKNQELETRLSTIRTSVVKRIATLDKEQSDKVIMLNRDVSAMEKQVTDNTFKINENMTRIRGEHNKQVTALADEKSKLQLLKVSKENQITTIKEGARTAAEQELTQLRGDFKSKSMSIEFTSNNIKISTTTLNNTKIQEQKYEQSKIEITERKPPFDLPVIEKDFKNKIEEFKTAYLENGAMADKLKVYEITQGMLSEEGIKSFFLKRLTPILNAKVNEYLDKFEIPVRVTFNDQMEESIHNIGKESEDVSYFSYSEGEKKSIDISILMSFIDITKVICNWTCNILMIDELIDAQVDFPRLEKIIECLKEFSGSGAIPSIYVISHRLIEDVAAYFKRIITTNKVDGFSEMAVKKI